MLSSSVKNKSYNNDIVNTINTEEFKIIMSKNKYTYSTNPMEEIIASLPKSFEVCDCGPFWMVFIKDLSIPFDIECDCRVAAMTLSCLWYSGSNFIMNKQRNTMEIKIPQHCSYLSFDFKPSYRKLNLNKYLGDLQGQWVVHNIKDDKYYGLVADGLISLSLDEWKERYKEKVIERLDSMDDSIPILKSAIGMFQVLLGLGLEVKNFTAIDMVLTYANLQAPSVKVYL